MDNLNNCKTSGVHNVPSSIVKSCAEQIASPLTHCIYLSFKCGIFPNILKHTLVMPLHKKGDKHDPGNYRGIYLSTFTVQKNS